MTPRTQTVTSTPFPYYPHLLYHYSESSWFSQVVYGLGAFLGFLCCCDGTDELPLPSFLGSSNPVYCSILWLHHHDHGVCYQGKRTNFPDRQSILGGQVFSCRTYPSNFMVIVAQHDPYFTGGYCSDCVSSLVLGQLFPHGLNWSPLRYIIRSKAGHCLDEWLSLTHVPTILTCIFSL